MDGTNTASRIENRVIEGIILASIWIKIPLLKNVFFTIHDLDVIVRMHDRQVPAVEPAALEGLFRGLGILVVHQHHIVAPHDGMPRWFYF